MTSPTTNKGYTYPAHGGAVNSWDTPLNTNFDQIDQNLGGAYLITIGSSIVGATYNSTGATLSSTVATGTLPAANAQNMYYKVTGTLTQNFDLAFPAVGSFYNVNNATSGSFTVTAVVSGSTAVNVPVAQGGTNAIVTDGADAVLANSNVLAKFKTFLGNPNGSVAGTAGAANGAATDVEWDSTNKQLYVATTSGTAATTVWTPMISRLTPQGYLSVSASTDNPIVTADTTSATVKYVPFVGSWTVLSDGTILFPYQFSAMTLTLTNAQASNIIYDVYMFYNAGTPMIGTGPAWTTSTAGAGSRGAAAAISRLGGIWTNTLAITLTNNGAPTACGAGQGILLGSIFVDSTAGNVSCLNAFGQSRKWGIANAYNREPIILQAGDPTASWNYNSGVARPSNNDSANKVTTFCCLPEENIEIEFTQNVHGGTSASANRVGIGVNSTTVVSGFSPRSPGTAANSLYNSITAFYQLIPGIGINDFNSLEYILTGGTGGGNTFYGTSEEMLLTAKWRG